MTLRMNLLGGLWQRSLDLVCPACCVGCQRELLETIGDNTICAECLTEILGTGEPVCPRCAARLPEPAFGPPSCPRCESDRLRFDGAFALGRYDGLLREMVLKMKTDRSGHLPRLFARLLVERFGIGLGKLELDAVTAIPLGSRKWLLGRSNAPAQLALETARRLGLPYVGGLLRWFRNPLPQHGLTKPGRFRNVQGKLQLGLGYSLAAPRILVVDDVLTTGATCSEAARTLKRQGASAVYVLVVGRTQGE